MALGKLSVPALKVYIYVHLTPSFLFGEGSQKNGRIEFDVTG